MAEHEHSAIRILAIRQPFALFEPRPWRPPLNIYETQQGLLLVAELAGVNADDLHIHVQPISVQIRGARQLETPVRLIRVQRMEIASGPFQIEVPLSAAIDPERTEAQYGEGLLDIWLPFAYQPSQRVVVIRLGEERT